MDHYDRWAGCKKQWMKFADGETRIDPTWKECDFSKRYPKFRNALIRWPNEKTPEVLALEKAYPKLRSV